MSLAVSPGGYDDDGVAAVAALYPGGPLPQLLHYRDRVGQRLAGPLNDRNVQ